jgi:hypothetical protein
MQNNWRLTMRKVLEHCPSCGGELEVTRMSCTECDTVIQGHYSLCRFCVLDPNQTRLLEVFVKTRGNVKEMERELEISYWTIRKQIDALIVALGLEASQAPVVDIEARQNEILGALERGEIDGTQAIDFIQELNTELS